MSDYVAGLRKMVMDREMSWKMFVYHCGVHYGYSKCCINNYVNLTVLGYSPAMFMAVVLGHNGGAGHVLCPLCHEKWMADHPGAAKKPEFDLSKPDSAEEFARLTAIKEDLSGDAVPTIDTIKMALQWWLDEAQYLTTGDYGEFNVFDEDPEWVVNARQLLGKETH